MSQEVGVNMRFHKNWRRKGKGKAPEGLVYPPELPVGSTEVSHLVLHSLSDCLPEVVPSSSSLSFKAIASVALLPHDGL